MSGIEDIPKLKLIDSQTIYFIIFSLGCRIIRFLSDPSADISVQRDWMDITINLPVSDWYNTKAIAPEYSQIDYPPFASYHQYLCGLFLQLVEPKSVMFGYSHGFMTLSHLIYMRLTVIIGEILILIPSFISYLIIFQSSVPQKSRNIALLLLITCPTLIIIDYDRFHYSNIYLGLCLFAVIFSMKGYFCTSAVFLAFSVSYKVYSLYYSLAFAVYWISVVIQNANKEKSNRYGKILYNLSCIVISGAIASFIIWWPWLTFDNFFFILERILAFDRPYNDDRISNFWSRFYICHPYRFFEQSQTKPLCFEFSLVHFFTQSQAKLICVGFSIASSLPFLYLLAKNPQPKSFLYSLAGVSLSFYLFGYSVHEKAILCSGIIIGLVTVFDHPNFFQFFTILCGLSIDHLKCHVSYAILQPVFFIISTYYIIYVCKIPISKKNSIYYIGMLIIKSIFCINALTAQDKIVEKCVLEVTLYYAFLGFCYTYYFLFTNQLMVSRSIIVNEISSKRD
jgi:alpha-1,3-glucosyltransferase